MKVSDVRALGVADLFKDTGHVVEVDSGSFSLVCDAERARRRASDLARHAAWVRQNGLF